MDSAYQLKKALPHIDLYINPLGGHTSFEKPTIDNYKRSIKRCFSVLFSKKLNLEKEIEPKTDTETNTETDLSYPIVLPFNTGFLNVGDDHQIYYEEYGNKEGIPFLFIHGGPGGGLSHKYSSRFDLSKIYLIGFDQRGAGRSIPSASIKNNTTTDLIEDIEKLRNHLNIKKWYLFGCSWGSTLSLLYSISYPSSVLGMVLYGIFLGRQEDIDWLYKENKVSNIFADEWDKFIEHIPEAERNDLIEAYYKRINSDDIEIRNKYSLLWKNYETNCSKYLPEKETEINPDSTKIFASSRIENYYMKYRCFLSYNDFILKNLNQLKKQNMPIHVIQARYDMVCPVDASYQLYKTLPHINYKIINFSNHDSYIKVSNNALIYAVNSIIS
jgi:proline iminopeptidase